MALIPPEAVPRDQGEPDHSPIRRVLLWFSKMETVTSGQTTAEIVALGCVSLYTQAMKIPTTITLEPDVRAALERAAACQDRTRSWVANRALRELLVEPQPSAPAQLQQEPLSR
jgi:hypothetical protein